jgi:hypothetical protein
LRQTAAACGLLVLFLFFAPLFFPLHPSVAFVRFSLAPGQPVASFAKKSLRQPASQQKTAALLPAPRERHCMHAPRFLP